MSVKMRTINPGDVPVPDFHQYLLGAVSPRPIGLASTIDENGVPNLAAFSFFNVFGANPPTAIISPNRRVSDKTTKDTLHNVQQNGEIVINAVSYDIVRQAAITGVTFPPDVSEFEMANLTPIPSDLVKPFRVKESPAHLECKVREIVTLGGDGGAGHLIICDILRIHIREDVIEGNRINPHKIDLMGRMGRAFYCRSSGEAIHTILQPYEQPVIGYPALPDSAKNSTVLSANDIGMLSGLFHIPTEEEVLASANDKTVQKIVADGGKTEDFHRYVSELLHKGETEKAGALIWYVDKV